MSKAVRHWIHDALEMLMLDKSIDRIRIKDICEKADVDMMTFKHNFKNPYDVLAWGYFRRSCTLETISAENYVKALKNLRKVYNECTDSYSQTCQKALWELIPKHIITKYRKQYWHSTRNIIVQHQMYFSIEMYWNGTTEVFRKWVTDKRSIFPEILAQQLIESMPHTMKKVFYSDVDYIRDRIIYQ